MDSEIEYTETGEGMGILRQCKPLHIIILILLVSVAGMGCTSFKRWLYEGFGRDGWQHREEVLQALHLKDDNSSRTLARGVGILRFYSPRLSGQVGRCTRWTSIQE